MTRYLGIGIAIFIGLSVPGAAQPDPEVLDFEELAPRCVATTARGDWGTGPVAIYGTGNRFGDDTNVAVVVDTAHPDADPDLAVGNYHNALIISRIRPRKPSGEEASWVVGSVDEIDDDNIPGGILSFDFKDTGPVTFYGLTLLDHDDSVATVRIYRTADAGDLLESVAPGTHLELTYRREPWWRALLRPGANRARLTAPSDEQPFLRIQVAPMRASGKASRIDVRELRARGSETRSTFGSGRLEALQDGIPDVARIEVKLGGSSAVDRLAFRPQGGARRDTEEDLFARIQRYLSAKVEPRLETLRVEFLEKWNALADNPTSTLRGDLDRLLADLEHDLIGEVGPDDVHEGGLLQCPELDCGCPQLRALQAWVETRIASMRADLADASEEDLATIQAVPTGAQIAALEPAVYLAAAQHGGRIVLAQQGGERCDEGTFGKVFFCKLQVVLDGAQAGVASLFGPTIELQPDSVVVADAAIPCQAFRLTPMSPEFDHVETGILPGQARRVPRGLYCVLCRTDQGLHPLGKLDLVTSGDATPQPLAGAECARGG